MVMMQGIPMAAHGGVAYIQAEMDSMKRAIWWAQYRGKVYVIGGVTVAAIIAYMLMKRK